MKCDKRKTKGEQKYAAIGFMNYLNYWMNCLRLKSSCLRNNAKKISIKSKHWYKIKISYEFQMQHCTRFTVQELAGALLSSSVAFHPRGHLNISDRGFFEEKQNCITMKLTGSVTEQHLLLTSKQTQASWKHLLNFILRHTFPLYNSAFMQTNTPLEKRGKSYI